MFSTKKRRIIMVVLVAWALFVFGFSFEEAGNLWQWYDEGIFASLFGLGPMFIYVSALWIKGKPVKSEE